MQVNTMIDLVHYKLEYIITSTNFRSALEKFEARECSFLFIFYERL